MVLQSAGAGRAMGIGMADGTLSIKVDSDAARATGCPFEKFKTLRFGGDLVGGRSFAMFCPSSGNGGGS
jgi:hypothetical protein